MDIKVILETHLDVAEAAKRTGYGRDHIKVLIRNGRVKATKVGPLSNKWYIPKTEVDRLTQERDPNRGRPKLETVKAGG